AVDWRSRWGKSWLCSATNQGAAGSCWAFAATALVETMVRIEHCLWSKRSEGDLRDGCGSTWAQNPGVPPDEVYAAQGGSAPGALVWAKTHGLADPDCVPYIWNSKAWRPTIDRQGRTARIPDVTFVGTAADQKLWIDTVGPIIAPFLCYNDFGAWKGPQPYRKSANAAVLGYHYILIVGYDDDKGCWIVRNSWGPGSGINGYFLFAYDECEIDQWGKHGLKGVSPDPFTRRRVHNGNLYQSSNGMHHKNFEVLKGGLEVRLYFRDGGTLSWGKVATPLPVVANTLPTKGMPALTSTTYNRNFETVFWDAANNLQHWVFDQKTGVWSTQSSFGGGLIAGYPGFIQSSVNAPGNMAVVVLQKDGRLHHWHRGLERDEYGGQGENWWEIAQGSTGPLVFANNVLMSGPSFVQSNVGENGNLYVVAVLKTGELQMWWNDLNDYTADWLPGEIFGSGFGSTPLCMIQGCPAIGDENTIGNFELCIASGGQIQHWYRENRNLAKEKPEAGKPKQNFGNWYKTATFGKDIRHVWGLIQGSFNFNLELIAERTDGKLQHFYRD
ncbi:cysteine proteinase, partial [Lentithecium fluviatile CBS 122367]